MGTYTYIGVTAYIKQGEGNVQRFKLLSELFDAFAQIREVSAIEEVHPHFAPLMQSAAFKNLDDHYGLFYGSEHNFPKNTPYEYASSVKIEDVKIKDQNLTRLYFPMNQKNIEDSREVEQDLLKVLMNVFGTDLVNVKRVEGDEYQDFNDLKPSILYAQAPVHA